MKSINNTCVEVLPALLNLRWMNSITTNKNYNSNDRPFPDHPIKRSHIEELKFFSNINSENGFFNKPRIKVGDEVKLIWHRESPKDSWFCKYCSHALNHRNMRNGTLECTCGKSFIPNLQDPTEIPKYASKNENTFPKHMTTVKITRVDILTIWKDYCGWIVSDDDGKTVWLGSAMIELGNIDGFKNGWDLFYYLDKNYDLREPKKFVRYGW